MPRKKPELKKEQVKKIKKPKPTKIQKPVKRTAKMHVGTKLPIIKYC